MSTNLPQCLSLDVETYGKVRGFPIQKHFHPARMEFHDQIRREDILQTVALSWRPVGGEIASTIIPWNKQGERCLVAWLEWATKHQIPILCQNTPFDIQVLRYVSPRVAKVLCPSRMLLWDLAITNFFDDPERPEKSLKDLSTVLGLGAYVEKGEDRHHSAHSPTLWKYNVEDTEKTLICHELLLKRLGGITPFAFQFYSDVLWNVIEMGEAGMEYDVDRLLAWHDTLGRRKTFLEELAAKEGVPLFGKGSQAPQQEYLERLFKAAGIHPRVTEKKGLIQTTEEQLKGFCNKRSDRVLRAWIVHKRVVKLLGTYTTPMIEGGKKPGQIQSMLVGARSYPTIYPVRMADKGEDWAVSGTKQCRFSVRHPPQNTLPGQMKSFWTTRFKDFGCGEWAGGEFWGTDASQLELRIAALLSGDPHMIADYQTGKDRHATTARMLLDWGVVSLAEFEAFPKKWRQVGKTINFAVLYKCGPAKLCEIIHGKCGVLLDKRVASNVIAGYYKEHHVFAAWQEELMARAQRDKRIEIPLLPVGRNYPAGVQQILSLYTNEIANIQVQGAAACVVHSGQRLVHKVLRAKKLHTVLVHNEHDALYLDSPRIEVNYVKGLVPALLERPPYYAALQDHVGRTVPLVWE